MTDAVVALPGVAVDVDLTVMTDEERAAALAQRLQGVAGGVHVTKNPFTDAKTRVLAIASGKGGVGKSSVTTNLSVALARRGRKVAAVDADVWGFSMPRMLGIDRPPTVIDDIIVPPDANGVRSSRWASSPVTTSPSSGAGRCCTRRSSSSSPTCTGASPTT